jgi:hypothetical protein
VYRESRRDRDGKIDWMSHLRRTVTRAVLASSLLLASTCASPDDDTTRQTVPQLQSSRSQPAPRSEDFVVAPDLPPLSSLAVANSGENPELVRAIHVFAARHPEVLGYMPCFCGCQTAGHKHNDDCFVAGRNSAGKVTAWDLHGVG